MRYLSVFLQHSAKSGRQSLTATTELTERLTILGKSVRLREAEMN